MKQNKGGPADMPARAAFYHPSALPPRDWLFLAALLWERIHISNVIGDVLHNHPEYVAANADAAMLLRLITESSICATSPPAPTQNLSKDQDREWQVYLNEVCQVLERFISEEDVPPERRTVASPEDLIKFSTLGNQVMLNERFAIAFPNIDYFFADHRSFVTGTHSSQHLLLHSVEAFVPQVPTQLSIGQLESFRADTALQRQRCRELMARELASFGTITAESDFVAALRRITDVMREQVELLKARCQQHRVDTVKRVFGLTLAAPATLQVMASALDVPFLQPAAVLAALSLAAADYLAAREKYQSELRSAPWAYLMSLRKLR